MAFCKCGRGFELGTTETQIEQVARAPGLEPGTAGLGVRRADHAATLPLRQTNKFTQNDAQAGLLSSIRS